MSRESLPCPRCGMRHLNGAEAVSCYLTPLSDSEAEQERKKEAYKKQFLNWEDECYDELDPAN